MKKRFLLFLIITLLLTGCSEENSLTVTRQLRQKVDEALNIELPDVDQNNCSKYFYSYYKSNGIGKGEADDLSNIFKINGNTCSLTLDVASIVSYKIIKDTNENEVRDIGSFANVIFLVEGIMTNSSKEEIPYKVSVTERQKNKYFVMIQTNDFVFISNIKDGNVADTVYQMLVLLRSTNVNRDEVIVAYGSENIIQHQTNVITLFEQIIPESGYIVDYIDDWKDDKGFIIIDEVDEFDEDIDWSFGDDDVDIFPEDDQIDEVVDEGIIE